MITEQSLAAEKTIELLGRAHSFCEHYCPKQPINHTAARMIERALIVRIPQQILHHQREQIAHALTALLEWRSE